jgi:hypothetical protein
LQQLAVDLVEMMLNILLEREELGEWEHLHYQI